MTKITREQFQAAIEAGIKNARLHDTDHADRLREIGRTAKETRTHGFGLNDGVSCSAVIGRLPAGRTVAFARKFDWSIFCSLKTYYVGVLEIVDD